MHRPHRQLSPDKAIALTAPLTVGGRLYAAVPSVLVDHAARIGGDENSAEIKF